VKSAAYAVLGLLVVAACADGVVVERAPAADRNDTTPDGGGFDVGDAGALPEAAAPLPECSADGWCYTKLPSDDALPDPNGVKLALTGVWVGADHVAWAVSAAGHVLRWNGTEWRKEHTAGAGLRSVWGSGSDVWVAGDGGSLVHGTTSTTGTTTFVPVTLPTTQRITRVWGTSPSDVWVLADRPYHLTADSVQTATPFVPVDVPSSFGSAVAFVRITAVWGSATDTWFAGTEVSYCAPPSCTNTTQPFAARLRGTTWDTVPMPITDATTVVAGASLANGVQVFTTKTKLFDTAKAAWIADDAAKLDPSRGAITVAGTHAWNAEIAESYGQPEALWGNAPNDVWLVGEYGVVRRFDGQKWQVSRVARTPISPLVNHLHAIDASASEMWIVGDDVALVRAVKP
jgi:hypothetical protein